MSEQSWIAQNFVWYTAQEGRDGDKISVVACMEVILSVAAYWWIAWYYDTYAHLLVSICLAPLVLLRSDESVELGLRWYERYWDRWNENLPLRHPKVLATIAISFVFGFGCALIVLPWATAGQTGPLLFLWSTLTSLLAISMGTAGVGVGAGAGALAVGLVGAVAGTLLGAVAGEGIIAVAGAGAVAGMGTIVILKGGAGKGIFLLFGLWIFIGYLLRTIGIRITASVRYLPQGIVSLSKNWTHTLFRTDLTQAPELVPGANAHDIALSLTPNRLWKRVFKTDYIVERILAAILLLILYTPALMYRYSIKSTCWLYLPLIYVAYRVPKDRMAWVRVRNTVFIEWVRLGLALGTLIVATLAWWDAAAVQHMMKALSAADMPFHPFQILLVLDWSQVRLWHWFIIPNALLTVGLFFGIDTLRKYHRDDPMTYPDTDWRIRLAIWLNGLRTFLVVCWLTIAFYYTVGYFLSTCGLPPWMVSLLTLHFPAPAC